MHRDILLGIEQSSLLRIDSHHLAVKGVWLAECIISGDSHCCSVNHHENCICFCTAINLSSKFIDNSRNLVRDRVVTAAQQTARRNVNCRTYEHRHFERILRTVARPLSMSGSGSVAHPSSIMLALGFRSVSHEKERGFQLWACPCLAALTLGNSFLGWFANWGCKSGFSFQGFCSTKLFSRPESRQDYPPLN
jgi:hypothetical protein